MKEVDGKREKIGRHRGQKDEKDENDQRNGSKKRRH